MDDRGAIGADVPPRALITGGAGFIGSHLAEALLVRGYSVTAIDDLSTGRIENIVHLTGHPRFQIAVDNIANKSLVDRLVAQSDVVYHLAAAVGVELVLSNPVGVIETNILGGHTVLQAAARHQKKVLVASTSEIYGKSTHLPFREDGDWIMGPTTKARWSYATSKAVDEFLGLAYHRQTQLPVVIFRLFNTVGPRQTGRYGMVIPRLVRQALKGQPLTVYGNGQQSRCFCDVEDAVRAIVGLSESSDAIGQVFNVGSTNEVTILELAQRVLRLSSEVEQLAAHPNLLTHAPGCAAVAPRVDDGRIVFIPYDQAFEPGYEDMQRRVPNINRIKAAIMWEPRVSLDTTLRRVIDYFCSAPSAD